MNRKKIRVLLIIEQCNPDWTSVPLVGYNFYEAISQFADTTLVTHERNKSALEKLHPDRNITYIAESLFIKNYYKIADRLSQFKGRRIWPLYMTLTYPVYGEFNHLVYTQFKDSILNGDYDIVHAITPMIPRYPVKVAKVCKNTPFMIGPVNGGFPFPKGFQYVGRQEFNYFNFLRAVGRFIIPGYQETYKKADYIFSGSTYTLGWIKSLFEIENRKIQLLYENGISNAFLKTTEELENVKTKSKSQIDLLFVGRLVPCKGADMLVDAISQLEPAIQNKISLTIVGDGSERNQLERQVQQLNLGKKIKFIGWVTQPETLQYYQQADIFCFPSIREFGGAVVLEAMANGLPCIVANYGGIGEYVTEKTGLKINPISRDFVVQELKKGIEKLVDNTVLRQKMSLNAIQRVRELTWNAKAEKIVDVYYKVLADRTSSSFCSLSTRLTAMVNR